MPPAEELGDRLDLLKMPQTPTDGWNGMRRPAEALQEALSQRSGSFLSQIVEKAGFSGTPIMGQGPSFSRVAKARLATGDVHDFVKVGNIGFLEPLLHRIPGIVDDDIDRAVRLLDSGGEGFDRRKVTKLELCGFRQGANRRRSILKEIRPAASQHHLSAGGGEATRDREAQSTASAGHQRALSVQSERTMPVGKRCWRFHGCLRIHLSTMTFKTSRFLSQKGNAPSASAKGMILEMSEAARSPIVSR